MMPIKRTKRHTLVKKEWLDVTINFKNFKVPSRCRNPYCIHLVQRFFEKKSFLMLFMSATKSKPKIVQSFNLLNKRFLNR